MWDMVLLLVYINLFGAVVYVLLCGQQDCHRDTFIEKCNSFLLGGCFESLANVCGNVFGKKARSRIDAIGDRCCNKPNPIFQAPHPRTLSTHANIPLIRVVLYLLCVLGPFIFFIVTSWHYLPGPYAPEYHKYLSFVLVGGVIALYFHVCRSDPGRITPATLALYKDNYPYDGILYAEKFCKTCQLPRPARSMHCRICNTCVSRFDHHCVWINNCVGERNQKKFIAFLFATAALCFYGFLVTSGIVAGIVEQQGILRYVMKNRATGEITPISYPTMFVIILFEAGSVVMVAFFSVIMGIVLFLFALYHVHLVLSNTTTAETFKWGDLKHDVEVAKKLLKKIDGEKADTKKTKKTKKKSNNRNDMKKKKGEAVVDTDSSESESDESSEGEGKSAKENKKDKEKEKDDDARFGSELYRHRKALTYSMHKRLSQRVKLDHMQWFAFKAEQLDRGQESKSAHHHKQQQKTEEERRYEEMTEERLNRAFLSELRWLADELVVDNSYNRGWRANFAEVLHPISERKSAAARHTKKRK